MKIKDKLSQAIAATSVSLKRLTTKLVNAKTTVLDVAGGSAFTAAGAGVDWRIGCVVFGVLCICASQNLVRQASGKT